MTEIMITAIIIGSVVLGIAVAGLSELMAYLKRKRGF